MQSEWEFRKVISETHSFPHLNPYLICVSSLNWILGTSMWVHHMYLKILKSNHDLTHAGCEFGCENDRVWLLCCYRLKY